jgi:hypothetical protein
MYRNQIDVESIKKRYPVGSRIILHSMGDDPRPIAPGTKGIVRIVDDMGTVHCNFDNGRRLGLIPGEYSFSVISERNKAEKDGR